MLNRFEQIKITSMKFVTLFNRIGLFCHYKFSLNNILWHIFSIMNIYENELRKEAWFQKKAREMK